MSGNVVDPPVWKPSRRTRVELPGFCVMHGGPTGMYLPEHEHPEVQVQAHFKPVREALDSPRDDMPRFFRLIPSGQPHRGKWSDGCETVVMLISRGLLERGASELQQRPSPELYPVTCGVDPLVHSIFSAVRREFLTGDIADALFVEAVGTVLTGHLLRKWSIKTMHCDLKGRLSQAQLRLTLDVIEQSHTSDLSIKMLADQIRMGSHQFTREFKRATGRTPYRFIMERRVQNACVLLKKTTMPLAEVALELGFASQSHFTSVFRQQMQSTPLVYRESFRPR
jgi:AraC-like DNA-binding protein